MKIFDNSFCGTLLSIAARETGSKEYCYKTFSLGDATFVDEQLDIPLIDYIQLDPNPEMDYENSIKIFDALERLTPVQANDHRIWVTMTHKIFFDYTLLRWKINDESSSRSLIDRFHFEGLGQVTRARNSLSRLWWSAYITHDKKRSNPFDLTKLLWSKQDIYMGILERKFGSYPNVVKGFLEFYSQNLNLKEDEIRRLFVALNALGGVKPLAIFNQNEIKEKLLRILTYNNWDKTNMSPSKIVSI